MKKKLFASFSGGRTSAYMTKWLLDNKSDEFDIVVVFANTGQEHEKTLEFVHNCDQHFDFNTVWVEAVVHHGERKASTHRVVTFETASRNGEPFEQVIKKYGISNKSFPHCTRELKQNPMHCYIRSLGWEDYFTAIGIRADEKRRVSAGADAGRLIYPLIDMIPTDKQDVNTWWEDQAFNLEIQEHQGNCTWCWKKSLNKHMRLIKESPVFFDFPRRMELEYGDVGPNPVGGPRVFFRENRSTNELFRMAAEVKEMGFVQLHIDLDSNGGCSESCELYPMEEAA